jgi:archaellum biogenesis ATPase FlaH
MTNISLSNTEFLNAISKPVRDLDLITPESTLWVCNKPCNGSWNGKSYSIKCDIEHPKQNTYFCISSLKSIDGEIARQKKYFEMLLCIVLDDVGTKAKKPIIKPSWAIETSKGNEQWGYILSEPIRDINHADDVIHAIAEAGYTDKGAKGVSTRYMRLPVGSNDKPEHLENNNGRPYVHNLLQWNPEVQYTAEELLNGLGVSLTPSLTVKSQEKVFDISGKEPDNALIKEVISSENYHDAILKLSARYQSRGMSAPDIIKTIEGFMNTSSDNSERWKKRYNDIPRAVHTAFKKYAIKPQKFKLLSIDEFMKTASPRWFIKELLPKKGIAMLYGQSGAGKSFISLDMMLSISRGIDWCNCRTKKGRVVYVVTEGRAGFRNRIEAYIKQYDINYQDIDIVLLPQTPDLTQEGSAESLAEAIKNNGGADVIVIDTLAQVSAGANENSAGEMGAILKRLQVLQEGTDSLVFVVHHAGKNKDNGARGSSAVFAAMDTVLDLRTSNATGEKIISLSVEKQKDAETSKLFNFRFQSVFLGKDEDGDNITSCVMEYLGNAVMKPEPQSKWQKKALDVVKKLMLMDNSSIPVGHIIDQMIEHEPYDIKNGKRDSRRESARRAISELENKGFLEVSTQGVKLSQTQIPSKE